MSEIKPISGAFDRVLLREAIPLKTPFTLNIFPTNLCNFKCVYCAQGGGKLSLNESYGIKPQTMSLETFYNIIEGCGEFKQKFKLLSFMGHGEPLVNKNIGKMVGAATKAQIADRTEIITNGSLLTNEMSRSLIDAGLTNIRISLQGISAKKYKDISGVDIDYDEFIENIAFYYKNKGKSNVFVKIMDISLDEGDEQRFYDTFDKISDRMYVEKVKPVYDNVDYGGAAKNLTTDRYGNTHAPRIVCPLPFFSIAVWPDGEVAVCDAIYKPVVLGNVNENSLYNLWNNNKIKSFWKEMLSGRKNQIKGCDKCCAPDDVSHEMDVLDGFEKEIAERL